ncbi:pantetheine-phosphate adenylyltransferase [Otariodibacter oris]|uniref:Phosphopantetheine adenylyltransferase n=1 Tax=Otariodibacter oris TaxID=1032623 RepID=A0A420XHS1_9PAST|nr:pantetheine-phosphate adenylyltransferase [Otariodibacter oris]QGM81334.1 pantetheine-phosphate adenylyltransferase [Otariodibacter oris]RKR72899.1 phosphopantetheine adenylyltransferase [Otariodibacter oris]
MTVIYAGTFDPITNGHLNIIQRAATLFPKVIVAVAENTTKRPLFLHQQRIKLAQESCQNITNVQVIGFSGLLVDLAKSYGAKTLIRGIRGNDDIDYEIQLAQLNNRLSSELDTVFLPSAVEWRYLSSTMVREIYFHQGDVAQFVPLAVNNALTQLGK